MGKSKGNDGEMQDVEAIIATDANHLETTEHCSEEGTRYPRGL